MRRGAAGQTVWTQRRGPTPDSAVRPELEDSARIIHSYAFRRLQGKTQVLGTHGGDFYRTRLTHSLEVAELGRALLAGLQAREGDWTPYLPSASLLSNICLAHDLGHPPFGHAGERTLNAAMLDLGLPGLGGFEANAQTLRLLCKLEIGPEAGVGLNLMRRLLLGVLKYPVAYSQALRPLAGPPKCYFDGEAEVVEWLLSPLSAADRAEFTVPTAPGRSFDCSLMELADDAAYSVYDLEDGVNLGLIARADWAALAAERPDLTELVAAAR